MNPEKSEKFHKLATARTQRVIQSIRLLKQCSNRRVYEYGQREVNQMMTAIYQELNAMEVAFAQRPEFGFRDAAMEVGVGTTIGGAQDTPSFE